MKLTDAQRQAIFEVLMGDVSPDYEAYEFLADGAARELWRIEQIVEQQDAPALAEARPTEKVA